MAPDIVLLFVGRNGNGKSSTANSVIGEKFFSTGKLCDEKNVLQIKTKEVDGIKMTVVDGTDIGDTGSDINGDLQDTIQKAETAVQLCEPGFNALIFVMTYGTRFNKQEKDAVDLIKSLFGRDIFRRFGIIVMTRGDQFEMDTEDDHKTFDQWCGEQTGDIKSLFQECDYRLALFDNKTKDHQDLSRQRRDLLKLVQRDKRYSSKDFNEAESGRKDIRLMHEFLETERESKALMEKIDSIIGNKKSIEPLNNLTDLYDQVTRYENDVLKKFQVCGSAQGLLNSLSLKKNSLKIKIKEIKSGDVRHERTGPVLLSDTLNVKSSDQYDYAFLLVGRSGNGKSSTGNSILGKKVFITRKPQDSSGGDVICYHSALVDEKSVFVVDGSGIGDTGDDSNGDINDLIESFDFTMRNDKSKFNAIVLVHNIHERSQVKMKSSVLAIKSILGPNVLKNWGIMVVTFGDQFDVNGLGENIHSFKDWCQQQTGYFQILLKECNNRCVLFDNITTDENKLMEQRQELILVVDSMTCSKYTIHDFDCPM